MPVPPLQYPRSKDTGVDWLGSIPEHWDIRPAFGAYEPNIERNTGMREKTVLSLSYGRIVVKPAEKLHGLVPESFETYQIVNPGDIVLRTIDLQNDHTSLRVGSVRNRGIITSAYLALRTKSGMTQGYGYQFLNVWDMTKAIYGFGSGLRQNLDFSHFKRMPVAVPPPAEQESIIRYLDHQEVLIRKFIASKQRFIALLNEQKQAIIQHAVTRGLNPNVRLKPSGVDLLGDVPEHWEARRLRTVADLIVSNVDKLITPGQVPVRLCNYVDAYKNERIIERIRFMKATASQEEVRRFRLQRGDVLVTKDSEEWDDIGVPSLVEYEAPDLVCGYHLGILRPRTGQVIGIFLLRALQCTAVARQLHVAANGVTRYGLSQGAIKDVSIPLPGVNEQKAITGALEAQLQPFSSAEAEAARQIALIREYRTRLIADVVTGKVDVRNLSVEAAVAAVEEPGDVGEQEEQEALDAN